MRTLLTTVLSAFLLTSACSTAVAQSLAFRVVVPDSAGLLGATYAAYDAAHQKVFFAAVGAVGVLGGQDGRRTRRIDATFGRLNTFNGVFLDSALGKVYFVPGLDSLVTVIDTRTESVVGTISVPHGSYMLLGGDEACLNTVNHKLYVMTSRGIGVFDTRSDEWIGYVNPGPLPGGSPEMCYNPDANKYYYMADGNNIAVCDGATDTLIKSLFAGTGAPGTPLYVHSQQRVYIPSSCGTEIAVVDGWGDSLLPVIQTPGGPFIAAANDTDGKLYVGHHVLDLWSVVDCRLGRVSQVFAMEGPQAAVWSATNDHAYLTGEDRMLVVDGRTDSLLRDLQFRVDCHGSGFANPALNLAYMDHGTGQLLAIDCRADSVAWLEYCGRWMDSPVWSPGERVLYTANRYQWSVTRTPLTPGATSVTCRLPGYGGHYPTRDVLLASPSRNKLYHFGNRGDVESTAVYVIDSRTMTLKDSIVLSGKPATAALLLEDAGRAYFNVLEPDTGPTRFVTEIWDIDSDTLVAALPALGAGTGAVYSSTSNKAFWPGEESLFVYDVTGDSLLRSVRVASYDRSGLTALAWDSDHDRVYAATDDASYRLKAVDCAADSVIAHIPGLPVLSSLTYVPTEHKLYCYAPNVSMNVVDCDRNEVVSTVYFSRGAHVTPVYNPRGNKLYVATHGGIGQTPEPWMVAAIDCATDRVVNWTAIGHEIRSMAVDPDSGYVIVAAENSVLYVIKDDAPAIAGEPEPRPARVALEVAPSPVSRGAVIKARLPCVGRVTLKLYDAAGRLVRSMVHSELSGGMLQYWWDGTDGEARLPAGTYMVRLESGESRLSRKVVLTD